MPVPDQQSKLRRLHLLSNHGLLLMALATALSTSSVQAQTEQSIHDGATEAKTKELMEKLQSPKFSHRREASRQLRDMGVSAHSVLKRIAESGDSESSTRAIDLLREASKGSDPEIADSAQKALQEIAAADGARGRSAGQAMKEPELPEPFRLFPKAFQPNAQPNLQPLRPPAFAPQGRTNLRISIRTVNGVKDIEVVKNDKKFRFRDAGAGMETERPDGKGGVKKATYKNSDELKQKDPEAYQAYLQAGGDKAGGALKIGPRGLFGNGFPPGLFQQRIPVQPNVPLEQAVPREQAVPKGPRIELHPEIAPRPVPKAKPADRPNRIEV